MNTTTTFLKDVAQGKCPLCLFYFGNEAMTDADGKWNLPDDTALVRVDKKKLHDWIKVWNDDVPVRIDHIVNEHGNSSLKLHVDKGNGFFSTIHFLSQNWHMNGQFWMPDEIEHIVSWNKDINDFVHVSKEPAVAKPKRVAGEAQLEKLQKQLSKALEAQKETVASIARRQQMIADGEAYLLQHSATDALEDLKIIQQGRRKLNKYKRALDEMSLKGRDWLDIINEFAPNDQLVVIEQYKTIEGEYQKEERFVDLTEWNVFVRAKEAYEKYRDYKPKSAWSNTATKETDRRRRKFHEYRSTVENRIEATLLLEYPEHLRDNISNIGWKYKERLPYMQARHDIRQSRLLIKEFELYLRDETQEIELLQTQIGLLEEKVAKKKARMETTNTETETETETETKEVIPDPIPEQIPEPESTPVQCEPETTIETEQTIEEPVIEEPAIETEPIIEEETENYMPAFVGTHHGYPTLTVTDEDGWVRQTFGLKKARIILENLEHIKAFVASGGKEIAQSQPIPEEQSELTTNVVQ